MRRGEEREGRGGGVEERKNRERGEKDARISISESTEGSIGTEKRNGKGGEGRGGEGSELEKGEGERERKHAPQGHIPLEYYQSAWAQSCSV